MQDDFDLNVVLSVLTGINISNYADLYNFFCFLFEDESIKPEDIVTLRPIAMKHILKIHPELTGIKYKGTNLYNWVRIQKAIFGEDITISIIGEKIISLEKQPFASAK